MSPIPQTSFLVGAIFCRFLQQAGSSQCSDQKVPQHWVILDQSKFGWGIFENVDDSMLMKEAISNSAFQLFGRSHNNRLQFDRCKIPLDGFFFEIVISSFFWTGPPLWMKGNAKYRKTVEQSKLAEISVESPAQQSTIVLCWYLLGWPKL